MAFFMHSDWLLKLKIFSAIKLRLFNLNLSMKLMEKLFV